MTTEIRIAVSQERLDLLTVDEMIAVETVGEKMSADVWRGLLAKFVMGKDGLYMPEDEAAKCIGKITRKQLREVALDFFQKVNEAAVNPTNDGS